MDVKLGTSHVFHVMPYMSCLEGQSQEHPMCSLPWVSVLSHCPLRTQGTIPGLSHVSHAMNHIMLSVLSHCPLRTQGTVPGISLVSHAMGHIMLSVLSHCPLRTQGTIPGISHVSHAMGHIMLSVLSHCPLRTQGTIPGISHMSHAMTFVSYCPWRTYMYMYARWICKRSTPIQ